MEHLMPALFAAQRVVRTADIHEDGARAGGDGSKRHTLVTRGASDNDVDGGGMYGTRRRQLGDDDRSTEQLRRAARFGDADIEAEAALTRRIFRDECDAQRARC